MNIELRLKCSMFEFVDLETSKWGPRERSENLSWQYFERERERER